VCIGVCIVSEIVRITVCVRVGTISVHTHISYAHSDIYQHACDSLSQPGELDVHAFRHVIQSFVCPFFYV